MKGDKTQPEDGSGQELRKADAALAVVLFAAAIALRIPFRSQFAYHWDSAQFALALGDYNIGIGQPQAPGFYLYVTLGRLMHLLVGDPHTALVWLSVIAGAWLVAVGTLLGTAMFGRKCGWGTGLILLTSPLCWFHSEVALTNIVDAALVASFIFACWQTIQRGVTWRRTVALAVLFATVAGVRQQSAPLLVPIWVYAFWSSGSFRRREFLCSLLLAFGLCLCWFVPTVQSAGGLKAYLHLLQLKSHYDAPRTVWGGGGIGALLISVACIGRACWVGLWVAAIIALMEFMHCVLFEKRAIAEEVYRVNRKQLWVLTLWIVPMLIFGLLLYVALPGHVLNFFPALALLASLGLIGFSKGSLDKLGGYPAVLVVVVVSNVVFFLYPPSALKPLYVDLPMTRVEIRNHDVALASCFSLIRRTWPAGRAVIYHRYEDFYWGFRQFEYYLPEYENVLLSGDSSLPGDLATKKWIGLGNQTTFSDEVTVSNSWEQLLVVPPGFSVNIFDSKLGIESNTVLLMDLGIRLYRLQR